MHPYIPRAAAVLAGFFGLNVGGSDGLSWNDLGKLEGLERVAAPEVLFTKLEDDKIAELRDRYAGSQKDRAGRESVKAGVETGVLPQNPPPRSEKVAGAGKIPSTSAKPAESVPAPSPMPYADLPVEDRFSRLVDLRTAKIVKIERHPKADKLYIETLDDGSGAERVIVSGLVPFYKEEELLGKTIVLVNNLKPAKLRGVESRGMLLAASKDGPEGHEVVEVLDVPWAAPGTRVFLETVFGEPPAEIDIDTFFSMPIRSEQGTVKVGSQTLTADGRPLKTERVTDGHVG